MPRTRLATYLFVAALGAVAPAPVAACAPCESGDPTLSVMGAATPYAGRVRAGTQLRVGWLQGEDARRTQVDLSAGLSVSPVDWLTLSVDVPLSLVDVERADLSQSTTLGPGDLTFRARALLLRDRRFQPAHLVSVTAGVRVPTSVDQVDGAGMLLPFDGQTGTGATAPLVGVSYIHVGDPVTLLVRGEVAWPLAGRYGLTPGPSAQLVVAPQVRVLEWLSLRGAVGLRADAPARVDGQQAIEGAVTLSVSPELLFRPEPDWLLRLGVQMPVLQSNLDLPLTEGAAVYLGLAVDLGGLR